MVILQIFARKTPSLVSCPDEMLPFYSLMIFQSFILNILIVFFTFNLVKCSHFNNSTTAEKIGGHLLDEISKKQFWAFFEYRILRGGDYEGSNSSLEFRITMA